jgi:isopenicillin N synthase-like dioxygenase
MDTLPLIDIAPLMQGGAADRSADRAAVAQRIGHACRTIGFFAIRGHGVPQALRQATFEQAARLFARPLAEKAALARRLHGPNRGYVGLGTEALNEHTLPDLKEAFNLMWTDGVQAPPNVWPALPGWRETVQAYFDAVLAVGRRLHQAFALDLGVPEAFFDDKLDHPMATLRLLHYPGPGAGAAPVAAAPGAGTHTDYGNVTLLATDEVAGLQVQKRDGGWIDVPALPEAFVCNIGDCLMRWSNDVYRSTPHRVLPPARTRQSIAFFLDPNPDALVSALPSCVPAGEAPRHPPVTAAEHLRQRFEATYGPGQG